MAIMIPSTPHEFTPASQEGNMFKAFELLPDDYYIFHSFRITTINDNTLYESETDFVIYHQQKGVICLEAKSGHVKYDQGRWYYGSDIPMKHGGPFNQASSNKWKLMKYIEKSKMGELVNHCKFLHAVWFPSISDAELKNMILPSEAERVLVLTKEALTNPLPYIEKIYALKVSAGTETEIGDIEHRRFIREILCPQFDVFPTASFDADMKKIVFHRLLKEQAGILNFLDEQKIAVINGAAGTGKTMIAVEKAQRHANASQKVLFLCYNAQLRAYLEENYHHENIDFYTVSKLACDLCGTRVADFAKLQSKLDDMYLTSGFPYQHVIVDEGQDFGMENIEEAGILDTLRTIIEMLDTESSFYVFYDKLQLIQAARMPKFIEDADCKLTLYRNCRNTENIAKTSLKPISERKPKLLEGAVAGSRPTMYFCTDNDRAIVQIDAILDKLVIEGLKDVVILSCKTEVTSILSEYVKDGLYKNKYRFSTCRKFKGLEADTVILIDLDRNTFNSENVQLFYVGASRARLKLEVISSLSDDDCTEILTNRLKPVVKKKDPKKSLANELNATFKLCQ